MYCDVAGLRYRERSGGIYPLRYLPRESPFRLSHPGFARTEDS